MDLGASAWSEGPESDGRAWSPGSPSGLLTTRLPLLVLATATTPVEGLESLALGPLDQRAHGTLVRRLLGLQGELAARVVARTGGNPMFAVQLVGDWVKRGILVPGESGFVLARGADAPVPEALSALSALARRRLEVLGPTRPALVVAACLGHHFRPEHWSEACRHAGIEHSGGLAETLLQERLLVADGLELRFAHPVHRDLLVDDAGALEHAACAAALRGEELMGAPGIAERLGKHLLAAGRSQQGRWQEAEAAARASLLAAMGENLGRQAEAIRLLGLVNQNRGRFPEAIDAYREALSIYESLGRRHAEVIRLNLVMCFLEQGRWPEAAEEIEVARTALTRLGRRNYLGAVACVALVASAALDDRETFDDDLVFACERLDESGWVEHDLAWSFERAGELAAERGWEGPEICALRGRAMRERLKSGG